MYIWHTYSINMSYFIIDLKGNVFYEACSLEEALYNCPKGYTIRMGNEL